MGEYSDEDLKAMAENTEKSESGESMKNKDTKAADKVILERVERTESGEKMPVIRRKAHLFHQSEAKQAPSDRLKQWATEKATEKKEAVLPTIRKIGSEGLSATRVLRADWKRLKPTKRYKGSKPWASKPSYLSGKKGRKSKGGGKKGVGSLGHRAARRFGSGPKGFFGGMGMEMGGGNVMGGPRMQTINTGGFGSGSSSGKPYRPPNMTGFGLGMGKPRGPKKPFGMRKKRKPSSMFGDFW